MTTKEFTVVWPQFAEHLDINGKEIPTEDLRLPEVLWLVLKSVVSPVSARELCCGMERAVNSKSISNFQSTLLALSLFSPALSQRTYRTGVPLLRSLLNISQRLSTKSLFDL
jgi:hypothetical protein